MIFHGLRRTPVLLAILAAALVFGGAPGAAAAEGDRIGGEDRFETAAALARATYPDGAPAALVARGDLFPDALASAGLAGVLQAPILLTRPEGLPQSTRDALEDLGVGDVVLLGGPGAISESVAEDLSEAGYQVERIGGQDRYETAALAADATAARSAEAPSTVFLATGELFPDALSVGPLAFATPGPIVLTLPGELHPRAREALEELDPEEVVVAGGEGAVAPEVVAEVEAMGIQVTRIGGRDRTDTSALMAEAFLARLGVEGGVAVLARGDAFPDALAAAPHAGALGLPLVLSSSPDHLTYDVLQWLVDRSEVTDVVRAVGGPGAVTDFVLGRAVAASEPPQLEYTYEVGTSGEVEADFAFFAEHADWTLTDPRGWSLDFDIRFTRVEEGGDFRLWLASPEVIEDTAPVCSAEWSCTVDDDVLINDERWRLSTETYSDRTLDDYRHYVVIHEVGHWLELGHEDCPGLGEAAPVMQQQSISLDGCVSNVWPLPSEREAVRSLHLG